MKFDPTVFVQVPFSSLGQSLPWLVERRVQPEVGFTGPDLDRADLMKHLAAIGEVLAGAGLRVTVHAPYNDLNPGALEPLVADVTRRRLLQTLRCARRLGACLVVVHPGYDPWRYGFHEELWLERSRSFWPEVLAKADQHNLPLALENVFDRHPRPLVDLLNRFGPSVIGCCFDVGHYHLFRSAPLEHWIEELTPFLVHLHLHDNHGARDEHLPIGEGSFDFARLFSLLRKHRLMPTMTLEARSLRDAQSSLAALQSFL